MVVDRYHVVQI